MLHALSASDQARIQKLKDPVRRQESILARHLRNELLASHPLSYASITHSHGLCAAVVCSRPVGIDVQPVRLYRIRSICTPQEWKRVRNDPWLCTAALVLKEAWYKMHRCSCTGRLPSFLIVDGKVVCSDPDTEACLWEPVPGFLLAVCTVKPAQDTLK